MTGAVIVAVGLEEHIIQRMRAVAADDGFIRIDIDFRIGKFIASLIGFAVGAGFADILCNDDRAGLVIGAGCFELIEIRYFNDLAERAAEIARLFFAVHVLAVAAEALQSRGIEQPFLRIAAAVCRERDSAVCIGQRGVFVRVISDNCY